MSTPELGDTRDPRQLVPGDVGAVTNTMWAMRTYGGLLLEAGAGLERITTGGGWGGEAAEQFRSRFQGQPAKWTEAGNSFHSAASALDSYATSLQRAQQQATTTIVMWDQGQAASVNAAAGYARDLRQAGPEPVQLGPFRDPGASTRAEAQRLLQITRADLAAAGQAAERVVSAARDMAPQKPGFWSKVSTFLGVVGTMTEDAAIDVVNGVASFGNAMLHHPGEAATLLGGALLTGVSATGEGLGLGLDATGVGALAGAPLNVISTAGVVAGVGMMGVAAAELANHAANEDRATVMNRSTGSGSTPRGTSGTKTDRMKEHLTDRDLDAARRELNGEVVATKPNGLPWDHVDEVRNAQRGLVNRIEQIQRQIGDTRLSDADRAGLQSELSEASRLLDYSEQFVPRI